MANKDNVMRVRLTFIDEILGTASGDPDIHGTYIASNAPDAMTKQEEIEAIGEDEFRAKGKTVFPRNEKESRSSGTTRSKDSSSRHVRHRRRSPARSRASVRLTRRSTSEFSPLPMHRRRLTA